MCILSGRSDLLLRTRLLKIECDISAIGQKISNIIDQGDISGCRTWIEIREIDIRKPRVYAPESPKKIRPLGKFNINRPRAAAKIEKLKLAILFSEYSIARVQSAIEIIIVLPVASPFTPSMKFNAFIRATMQNAVKAQPTNLIVSILSIIGMERRLIQIPLVYMKSAAEIMPTQILTRGDTEKFKSSSNPIKNIGSAAKKISSSKFSLNNSRTKKMAPKTARPPRRDVG